eukprot:scaffold9553_cov114-Isochrysis_galbana.AAC.18
MRLRFGPLCRLPPSIRRHELRTRHGQTWPGPRVGPKQASVMTNPAWPAQPVLQHSRPSHRPLASSPARPLLQPPRAPLAV